jgi:hypothetical protein
VLTFANDKKKLMIVDDDEMIQRVMPEVMRHALTQLQLAE